ncbi:hypothetical protein [uncultured Psychromonas sp.]|uniref:COG3014 family protein n=1 Tax=uncultured Psychromonas sp. TaxID=173974 RepID=UPI0026107175|nr:hypothetical protein [uncultured Psychromonas sp.]
MHKLLIVLLFSLTGCAAQQNNNKLANELRQTTPEHILSILQENKPDTSDIAQYYLNLGYLQLLSGEFTSAIESLSTANKEMQLLSAISITENVAAGTINETLRRYSGYPLDRVMVHNMLALSYLFNQDIEGARVEMLQADVEMKKLSEGESLSGQLASTHLLSAIIYELLDERSDAFISYQLTENILNKRQIPLPEGLKLGLLRASKKMGNDQAYDRYSKLYPRLAKQTNLDKQVFILYFNGVVANKEQRSIVVPSFNGRQLIRVSVPGYPNTRVLQQQANISDGLHRVNSALIENIDVLAKEDLDKEYPSILLLTTTRAVAKYKLVEEAQKKDPLLGALLNFATLLSEVADLRSWNMLPAMVQFGYLETDFDNITLSANSQIEQPINLNQGKQHVILTTGLSDKIFHYQQ